MKRALFIFYTFASLFLAQYSSAQEKDTLVAFPGGNAALESFIKTRLLTTKAALTNNISGDVVLKFVVDEKGQVDDVTVAQKLGYGCDEQAIRVIRQLPHWQPGVISGKRVRTTLQQTIHFDTSLQPAPLEESAFRRETLPNEPLSFGTKATDLEQYIQDHFVYPASVRKNVDGTIVLKFRISPEGIANDIQLVAGLGEALDQEAIRVIKNMPAWLPKLKDFRPVEDYKELVIGFKKKKPLLLQ